MISPLLKATLALSLIPLLALAAPASADVVISEVDYDQPSNDTAEWIELYNPDPTPFSLVGLDLVLINGNGGGCAEYRRVNLDTVTIPAGGLVVLGNHPCADPSVVLPPENWIQNGSPDAIRIEERVSGTIRDGVEYENTSGTPNCGGLPTAEADAFGDPSDSLQLCSGVWAVAIGTPCGLPGCGPIPILPESWGTVKSYF